MDAGLWIERTVRRARARDGNVAVMFALLLPVICLAAGAGLDFQGWNQQRTRLQELADTLALRGARELLLANATEGQIENLIAAIAASDLPSKFGVAEFELDVSVDEKTHSVTVVVAQRSRSALILSKFAEFRRPMGADATASAQGGSNVCVIALEGSASSAIEASLNSRLDAGECALMSNSTSSSGVRASGSSKMTASLICSAGGYSGPSSAYSTAPTTDCPVTEDPLIERDPPAVGPCDHQDFIVGDRSAETFKAAISASIGEMTSGDDASDDDDELQRTRYVLEPGTYCGGLTVGSNASAVFNPGVYVVKGGPFTVDLNAEVLGDGVGFYLEGDDSVFFFSPDSKIELSAPRDGLMAGILFFEDRNAKAGRTHSILSNDARTLLGTFYLPNGTLFVSTMAPVADRSAYTAIVARRVRMAGSPTLVLNADYALTDVPVPDGVGPVGGEVFLRE